MAPEVAHTVGAGKCDETKWGWDEETEVPIIPRDTCVRCSKEAVVHENCRV